MSSLFKTIQYRVLKKIKWLEVKHHV